MRPSPSFQKRQTAAGGALPIGKCAATIYCRVSSDRQSKEGSGLSSQEQRCRSYAAACGYDVQAVFSDDGVSGALLDRPGIRALLAFLRSQSGGVVVIVDDISRIARDVKTHLELRTAISAAGGMLESPSMRFEDSAAGEFIEMVLAASAQFGRKGNREQVLNRMKARLQSGYWAFPLPMGYAYEKHPVHKKIGVPTRSAKQILKPALQAFAQGRLGSQRALALHLQSHGFFGAGNSDSIVTLAKRLSALRDALPFYAGWIEYPKWGVARIRGQHEPILDAASFAVLEARFAPENKPEVTERKDERPELPLRGFVRCPECGRPLTGCLAKRRYPRYFCFGPTCPRYGWSLSARLVEPAFEELLQRVTPNEGLLEFARVASTAAYRKRLENRAFERQGLERAFAEKAREIEAMIRRLGKTTIDSIAAALENEITALQRQLSETKVKLAKFDQGPMNYEAAFERVSTYLKDPAGIWKNGSLNEKKTVHRVVFTVAPTFGRNEGLSTYELTLPYLILASSIGSRSRLVDLAGETWHSLHDEVFRMDSLIDLS